VSSAVGDGHLSAKRTLLIFPTLLGIMLTALRSFSLRPRSRAGDRAAFGHGCLATARISGSTGDGISTTSQSQWSQADTGTKYRRGLTRSHQAARAVRLRQAGARALPADDEELPAVDFEKASPRASVLQLIKEKLPVSIARL
jgi:ABC-type microcin C transport system permease subunit YejB